MSKIQVQFGEKLRRVRKKRGISQEKLAELASEFPKACIRCLRLIAEKDREGWELMGADEYLRPILKKGIQSPHRSDPIDLINYFGARGLGGFRDLLR